MDQELLAKHETLVVEIGEVYLDNMETELGKMYKNNHYEIHAGLTNEQMTELKRKHQLSNNEFADLYSEFLKIKPTKHMNMLMDAFHASGGNVDVEPFYDEDTQRLKISVQFIVKDNTLETIEGLSPIENYLLRMNAMIQVANVLSGSESKQSAL